MIKRDNSTRNFTTALPPTGTPFTPKSKPLNYTFYGYSRTCLWFDDKEMEFSSDGCSVSVANFDAKVGDI